MVIRYVVVVEGWIRPRLLGVARHSFGCLQVLLRLSQKLGFDQIAFVIHFFYPRLGMRLNSSHLIQKMMKQSRAFSDNKSGKWQSKLMYIYNKFEDKYQ